MAAVKFYLHGGRFGFVFGDLSKGEFHYEEIYEPPPPPPPPSAGQPPGHHFSLASTSLIATAALLSACALLLAVCLIFTYRLRNRTSENDNSSNFWLPEWLRRRQQRSRSLSTRGLEGGILGDQDQDDDFPLHINHVWYVRTAGLDRSLIDSISTFKFVKIQQDKAVDQDDDSGLIGGSGGEMTNCSVCLSEFQEGEELRLLPKCSHAFHRDCIDMWLSSHINCPLCRTPVIITAAVDNTSATAPIASPPPPPASSSPSSSSSLPSSSTSASADAAIVVNEKGLMDAGGKLKLIRRSVSMDDCSSLTTTRGVLFRLQSGRQHKRPLRSKSSSYCSGQLWKEELNENTN